MVRASMMCKEGLCTFSRRDHCQRTLAEAAQVPKGRQSLYSWYRSQHLGTEFSFTAKKNNPEPLIEVKIADCHPRQPCRARLWAAELQFAQPWKKGIGGKTGCVCTLQDQ